jgi:uncharacterized protein
MEASRKYRFTWKLLGDAELGRPNLGNLARVEAYRLMQFSFRDTVEQHFGAEKADFLFREAGRLAGAQFYEHAIGTATDFDQLASQMQKALKDLGICILRIEKADIENWSFALTMSEDIDCSGLPDIGYPICAYEEGFVRGVFETFSGKPFEVREIECWSNGSRTCRFTAELAR